MLVSVIVPCYNVEKYIEKCLASIYVQSYKDLEVILVDDGSSDETVLVINKYLKKNSRSAVLLEQQNKGAASARNRGLQKAKGEYVQFLDADDWIKPSKIEAQVRLINENNFPDLIVGSYVTENESGVNLTTRIYGQELKNDQWLNLIRTNLGNTCSNLFKRQLFLNRVNWDETLKSSQEYNLMFEILKQDARLAYDSNINTVIIRREVGSISTMNKQKSWSQYIDLRRRILEWMREKKLKIGHAEYQAVFDALRMSAPYDISFAAKSYNKIIPKSFVPTKSATSGGLYLICFKIFGFKRAEQIWKLKNKIINQGIS